jgi:phage shock protein A
MKIFTKLNTLLRAGARESAERFTDANAIRIYRQEIVDAENLLERRRLCLAGLIATRKDLEKEVVTAKLRIRKREEQIAGVRPEDRSEELLLLAARDIAATESHLLKLKQRLSGIVERVDSEERTLRKLVAEIKEHRREIRILSTELSRNGRLSGGDFGNTVAGHLATLRDTRASITGAVASSDVAEESFIEAGDRVDGDPLDRELASRGRDSESLQLANVLERLRGIGGPASGVVT